MKYDYNLDSESFENSFSVFPGEFNLNDRELLSIGLGAVLYIPGNKKNLAEAILKSSAATVVICLEDAIDDSSLKLAHHNLLSSLEQFRYQYTPDKLPLLFVRGRNHDHFKYLASLLYEFRDLICGFVLPKFTSVSGEQILCFFSRLQSDWEKEIHLMPILETGSVLFKDNRYNELLALKNLFDQNKDQILNVRIGATDMSGLYGIRRPIDLTVWDIALMESVLSDIVNYFARKEEGFVISGPVWEYYRPFDSEVPGKYSSPEIRGLIAEVELDMVNGLLGKSVIHPSQIMPVLSRLVVPFTDYMDASAIINSKGGASAGYHTNRMNEKNPHLFWAQKIMKRSKIYGVLKEDLSQDAFLKVCEDSSCVDFSSKNILISNNY